MSSSLKAITPFPTKFAITLSREKRTFSICEKLNATLSSLALSWSWDAQQSSGIGETGDNTWSRAARRKQQKERQQGNGGMEVDLRGKAERIALAFRVTVREELPATEVTIRWLRGADTLIWESFCGWLRKTLTGVEDLCTDLLARNSTQTHREGLQLRTGYSARRFRILRHTKTREQAFLSLGKHAIPSPSAGLMCPSQLQT